MVRDRPAWPSSAKRAISSASGPREVRRRGFRRAARLGSLAAGLRRRKRGPDGRTPGLHPREPLYSGGPNRGKPRGFEELWAGAIFELHNVTYARQFLRLHEEAAEGKLAKEQFVADIWKYEYWRPSDRALLRAGLSALGREAEAADRSGRVVRRVVGKRSDTLAGFADKTAYPWRPYSRQYDWMTVHRLYHDGKFGKTLCCWPRCGPTRPTRTTRPDMHYWIGRCQSRWASRPWP